MERGINTKLLWITAAVLGAVVTLLTSFGWLPAVLLLALVVLLILRSKHLVALSGLLVGFGALWLLLMARQFASGGTTGNDASWIAVGAVPLVLGCAVVVLSAARSMHSRQTSHS